MNDLLVYAVIPIAVTTLVVLGALQLRWLGDVIGLAMPIVIVGAAVLSVGVLAIRPSSSAAPLTLLLVSALVVFVPRVPQRTATPVSPLRIAAVNLQFDSLHAEGGVASALAVDADVLVVSELTDVTDAILTQAYPYRAVREDVLARSKFAEGVYSRVPLTRLDDPVGITEQMLRVRVGVARPFVLYAVHLPRPGFPEPAPSMMTGFGGHREMTLALDAAADRETEPVLIAGDLNLSDRTSGYRRLSSGRLDVSRTGWAGSTFDGTFSWSLLLLRIDHLFAPSDWCATDARSFTLVGSDHLGIVGEVGTCP